MHITISIDENGKPYVNIEKSEPVKRIGKGKSVISFPENYIMIDIETTGLDTRFCEIIEISAVKYLNHVESDVFTSLVKPSEPIDDFITSLTGITNEMLADAPDIRSVIEDFYNFVGCEMLVGYNVNFDINFLYDSLLDCKGVELRNPFIDVMRISRRLLPELKNHKLETVSQHFGVSSVMHRALDDCHACNDCFVALEKLACDQYGSVEAFCEASKPKSHKPLSKDIVASSDSSFDEGNPLFGKTICFTGVLEKMLRKDAMQLVVDLGGFCSDTVTSKTNYLVIGNNDFCSSIKDGKSSKQKKAESMILKGKDLEILTESTFYEMVLGQ